MRRARPVIAAILAALPGAALAQPCRPEWDVRIGNQGLNSSVLRFIPTSPLSVTGVLAGGAFWEPYPLLAVWDGSNFTQFGPLWIPSSGVTDIEYFDDGDGEKLYISGNLWTGSEQFHVARFEGDHWEYLDIGGVYGVVDMHVWDDGSGPALYVTGDFDSLDGVTPHNSIAKWDGQSWSPLRGGLNFSGTQVGLALQGFDDGSGPMLYLGGTFDGVDSKFGRYLARWDGRQWSGMPNDEGRPHGSVQDMCLYDDGSGEALYVVGLFDSVGGILARHIARWDGAHWSDVGGGTEPHNQGFILSCGVWDDGSGPALFVSGWIMAAGGKPMCNFAKWDGVEWSDPGGGLDCAGTGSAFAIHGVPWGSPLGPSLYVGGAFSHAGGEETEFVAEYAGCECPPDWNGDGLLNTIDFLAFLNTWSLERVSDCVDGSCRADLNGDGSVNTIDVVAYLNQYTYGC